MIGKIDILRLDAYSLNVLVSVCETVSVSKTAANFEVSQSSISHVIEKLRNALGDPLFIKAGRGITPTDRALRLLPRAKQIIADVEGLADADSYDISDDGRPVVIAIPTPAVGDEMKMLHQMLLEHAPGVTLELRRLAPRSQLVEILSNGDAEIAISVRGVRYPAILNHCPYGQEELAVFYDPTVRGPVTTLEQYLLARHGVVSFGGNDKSEVESSLDRLGVSRNISIVAPTASMLGELIRETDVIATMPRRLGCGVYRALASAPPPLALNTLKYDLVWHRRYEHSSRNQWLRRAVMQTIRKGTGSAEAVPA